jgi:peptide/nickel transport system substrate-binding protein
MNQGNSAGSGPFVITEWVKDDHMTMVANSNYWDQPKPRLNKVIFKHVATPDAELLLLQQGEVDVIWDPTPSQVNSNQFTEGIATTASPQATTSFLWLNQSQAPFNAGSNVWNAVKSAIDYDGLINNVILGTGVKVQTLSWKGLPGYDSSTPYQQDPATVKQLLTQAGFPNGTSITLSYNSDDDIAVLYAPKLQSDLQACGITTQLSGVPGGQLLSQLASGNFQALTTWEGGGLQHIANVAWWNLDPRFGFFPKWTNWTSPDAEKLVDATKTASDADFPAACQAMTEWALKNAPSVPLFQKSQQVLYSSGVVGLVMPFSRLNTDYSRVYKQATTGNFS